MNRRIIQLYEDSDLKEKMSEGEFLDWGVGPDQQGTVAIVALEDESIALWEIDRIKFAGWIL